MAWINVHEDVVGPKLRHLAKLSGSSRHEALGALITLWLWGIKNADQSGLIKSADKEDVADVISPGLSEGLSPTKMVDSMVEAGWIDEQDGELYLHDWDEWQEMWYKYLGRKEQDMKRKRKSRGKEPDEVPAAPRHPDIPEENPPKPAKPQKEKPQKIRYAEFVHMTEDEYQKLCDGFGEEAAKKFVEVLDLYKGSKGKTYKDDYRAILSWVIEKVKKEAPGIIKVPESSGAGNPFAEWRGGGDG